MNSFAALIIRHDLDEISKTEFHELISYEKDLGGKYVYFTLQHQVSKNAKTCFPKGMSNEEKQCRRVEYLELIKKHTVQELDGIVEFALHSEAKPKNWTNDNVLEKYTHNLKENRRLFETKIPNISGHSTHSDEGALYLNTEGINPVSIEKDARILNAATVAAGFEWFSCTKDLSYFREGALLFPPCYAPYKVGQLTVFPIGWDDYFFHNLAAWGSLNEITGKNSIKEKMTECKNKNIPCVVSLHPMRFLRSNRRYLYSISIIEWLLSIAKKMKMQNVTFSEYVKLIQ